MFQCDNLISEFHVYCGIMQQVLYFYGQMLQVMCIYVCLVSALYNAYCGYEGVFAAFVRTNLLARCYKLNGKISLHPTLLPLHLATIGILTFLIRIHSQQHIRTVPHWCSSELLTVNAWRKWVARSCMCSIISVATGQFMCPRKRLKWLLYFSILYVFCAV